MTSEPPTTPFPPDQPPAQPPFAPPPAPQRKLSTGAVVAIVIGAVVLACCGLAGISAVIGEDSEPAAQSSPSAQAAVASVAPATSAPLPALPSPSSVTTTAPAPSPTPAAVVMPDLVGMNAAVAQDKLRKLGLTNIQLGSQDENDTVVFLAANWTVTKQSHKKGSKVGTEDLVVLTCTKKG